MQKKLLTLFLAIAMAAVYLTPAQAIDMDLKGVFKTWSISQNDFRAGKDDINDWYTVSLVRLKPIFSAFNGDVKVTLRMDLAQGWWGVDNQRGSFKNANGGLRTHAGQNGLFTNKETNYAIHVDEAWIDLKLPFLDNIVPSRLHVGRMYTQLGNKLVFDYEVDGARVVSKWNDSTTTTVGYAILSEGYEGLSDNTATQYKWDALTQGAGVSGGAARMGYIQLNHKLAPNSMGIKGNLEAFVLGYYDAGTDDGSAYLRDDIDYSIARFQPQIGDLWAVGLAGNLSLDEGNISVKFEVDGLWGGDPINNQTYNSSGIPDGFTGTTTVTGGAPGRAVLRSPSGTGTALVGIPGYPAQHYWNRLDINDGDIYGWNVYMNAKFHYLEADYKVTPGLIIGAGSGDDDKSSGNGNVNKLQTEGWMYVCEVWEDSIMPDLTGITPQGLGSPWSRSYREFENQILVQPNVTWKFAPKWSLFLSYTYVHALENIYAWEDEPTNHNRGGAVAAAGAGGLNANNDQLDGFAGGGFDPTRFSKDLGHEVDWKLDYTIFPKLVLTTRGGYFFTGDGASYLIAGAKAWDKDIYELRWDLTYKF